MMRLVHCCKTCFQLAKKTEALPEKQEQKVVEHIEECMQRSKQLRKAAKLEGKTEKIDLDGDDAPRRTAEEMLEKLERYVSAHGDSGATVDDAVERVRALRDEWS